MTNEEEIGEILKLLDEAETELPRNAIPKICKVLRHMVGAKRLGSEDERSDVESPIDPPDGAPTTGSGNDPDAFEAT